MTDDPRQLQLFENFGPRPSFAEPSSEHSSEPSTSSSASSPNSRDAASSTASTTPATAKYSPDGAAHAARLSRAARRMEERAARPLLPMIIASNTGESMLAVPRPTTLAQCAEEARPCPWVGCRHHLLLEVASPNVQQRKDPRATTMRLNMPRRGRVREGRRPGLASSAAEAIVRTWIDEAVELLFRMRYTCTFDVVRDFPDGLSSGQVALVLGVTEQATDKELRIASHHYREQVLSSDADGGLK